MGSGQSGSVLLVLIVVWMVKYRKCNLNLGAQFDTEQRMHMGPNDLARALLRFSSVSSLHPAPV